MYTNKDSNGNYQSFGFLAPDGVATEKNEVLFPWHEKQEPAYGATLAVTLKHMETVLQPAQLTGNATINLTINSQVTRGAKLYLKVSADTSDRTVVLGTGFDAAIADIVVPAGRTLFRTFIYDGTSFVAANEESGIDFEKLTPAYGATLAVTIAKHETVLKPAELTGAVTINLTIGATVKKGAKLVLVTLADGSNRVVTLGTGFDAAAADYTNTASTTFARSFIYDGTAFIPMNQ